jgi:molecular chaperone HtpG
MLTDEKFCDSAMKFALMEDTDGKFFKIDDYKKLITTAQTDKDGNLIFLYANNKEEQYTYIKAAKDKGYNVLFMDSQLDPHFIGLLERKIEKSRFERVDADVIDNIIRQKDKKEAELDPMQRNIMTTMFKSQIPAMGKSEFMILFEPLSESAQPVVITQSEYMRRMKEMAAMQPGMSFYGELPDSYNMTLNVEHPVVKKIMESAVAELEKDIKPLDTELESTNAAIKAIHDAKKDDKELDEDKKKELADNEKKAEDIRKSESDIITKYASRQDKVKQLVDIALLGNGLLKGEALNNFLKRSVDLL